MIDHAAALAILRGFQPWSQSEDVSLEDSVGRVLNTDLFAHEASPPFDNSAMDGFALVSSLTTQATPDSPVHLPVNDCVAAGDMVSGVFAKSQAVEIMTGAPIPAEFFDTVVKIEEVEVCRDAYGRATKIILRKPVRSGENIRRSGEDFQFGQAVMKTGQVIELSHLMALATLGFSRVCVARMPNIALISTGRELVDPSSPRLQPGQIRNSTGLYLKKYFESLHHPITECGTVSDDPEDYLKRLTQALDSGAEVVISTGAVSMGKFDFVKPALEKLGAKIHFHKCAIRPGKPILFASGNWRGKTVFFFGVPGNPVSTAVGLRFFVRPFLDHMLGIQTGDGSVADGIALRSARLINDFKKPEGLRCFFKAIERVSPNGETLVEALPGQASFMVSPLLKANSWVVFPESGSSAKAGSMVEVCHL